MSIDVNRLSNYLAANKVLTDYDFWRARKTINHVLYLINRHHLPVPMEVIRARVIIDRARMKRNHH